MSKDKSNLNEGFSPTVTFKDGYQPQSIAPNGYRPSPTTQTSTSAGGITPTNVVPSPPKKD